MRMQIPVPFLKRRSLRTDFPVQPSYELNTGEGRSLKTDDGAKGRTVDVVVRAVFSSCTRVITEAGCAFRPRGLPRLAAELPSVPVGRCYSQDLWLDGVHEKCVVTWDSGQGMANQEGRAQTNSCDHLIYRSNQVGKCGEYALCRIGNHDAGQRWMDDWAVSSTLLCHPSSPLWKARATSEFSWAQGSGKARAPYPLLLWYIT